MNISCFNSLYSSYPNHSLYLACVYLVSSYSPSSSNSSSNILSHSCGMSALTWHGQRSFNAFFLFLGSGSYVLCRYSLMVSSHIFSGLASTNLLEFWASYSSSYHDWPATLCMVVDMHQKGVCFILVALELTPHCAMQCKLQASDKEWVTWPYGVKNSHEITADDANYCATAPKGVILKKAHHNQAPEQWRTKPAQSSSKHLQLLR